MRYFCRVAYDGTNFCGWQRQPNGISVQQVLEEAATKILRTSCKFTGAGRTDAGVHAKAMGVHFDHDGPIDTGKFTVSMNAVLPCDVAVYNVTCTKPSFHARFSALQRSYRYYLCLQKSPLLEKKAWRLRYRIDWGKLMVELPDLLGKHDFSAFCASGSGSATAICTVTAAAIEKEGDCMVFYIKANRFVYNMVRSITGTLIDIGRGRCPYRLQEILERKDRSLAGTTAPACGLVLDNVVYAEVE
jgi:tRNA pseudouridine38-40 synthase